MMITTSKAQESLSRAHRQREPLRIVQLASHSNLTRGGAIQLVRLAIGLKRMNHQVVCAFNLRSELLASSDFTPLRSHGIEVVAFDLGRVTEMLRFRRWCQERDIQVVHVHRDQAASFACLALLGLSHPMIVAGRGTVFPLKPFTPIRFWFRSCKIRGVIAVAEAVKESLVKCGVDHRKIEVVYGGVEEDLFSPGPGDALLRAAWADGAVVPLVGNVAAISRKKGHDVFFRAAALVLARFPDCRFVCVGKGKWKKLLPLLEQLKLTNSVVFTGHRTDMPDVMRSLDVVISSSTSGEGLTGTIREAMACARPVVATDVGGNRELVQDGINGRLVEPDNPDALARAIIALLSDGDMARRFSAAARTTVLDRFTNDTRCIRIDRIYRSLLTGVPH